ncbi:YbaK/EbsC family protein [Arthrobacter gandavensis]|uniref:YbaK/EbsC family protein n=1 Tax=Arthrobacter gandavensis TaxID=169960 RepID=UPI00188DF580|nr:YbaK/EbsC family protein [Arthrobacter gandavensis]MBF4995374.1 YbaK/EbsC family protein [Arthrobacter gandavensis]
MENPEWASAAARVKDALAQLGSAAAVVVTDGSAHTAAEAAQTLGCAVGAIGNSLVFMADGVPLLVITSGAHRVDTAALAQRLNKQKVKRASAGQVHEATGQQVGGVAPIGHPSPVETVIDRDLAGYPDVWVAAGTPYSVFRTDLGELVRLTGGAVVRVD